jgi:uncharacterized repeat protein (TIGR01451 family)
VHYIKQKFPYVTSVLIIIAMMVAGTFISQQRSDGIDTAQAQTTVGPRGPIGPDVPLTSAETTAYANRITVSGLTTTAIRTGISQAVSGGKPVVYLPAGTYTIDGTIAVPGGLTILGAGSSTFLKAANESVIMFEVNGNNVHFTRLLLEGGSMTWNTTNNSRGISAYDGTLPEAQNLHIDYSEIRGFAYGITVGFHATAQVDHNKIHHMLREGLGYGINVGLGAYALIMDNQFYDSRHMQASGGRSDFRPTHWEFRNNWVSGQSAAVLNPQSANDTHPGMTGTFIVENNLIESVPVAGDYHDGSGIVRNNTFKQLSVNISRIQAMSQDGIVGVPHNLSLDNNTLDGSPILYNNPKLLVESTAKNVRVNGTIVPVSVGSSTPNPMIFLKEMGTTGNLTWTTSTDWWTNTTTPTPTPTPTSAPGATAVATVTLAKTVDKASALSSDILTYTLTAKNTSTVLATPVKVSDVLPSGTTFVAASDGGTLAGSTVTWNLVGGLAAGATKTITLQVKVGSTGTATLAVTPTIVTVGATVTVTVSNAPGNPTSWVGLYATGTTNNDLYKDWKHLNGTKTPPATGLTNATLTFPMPTTAGTYEFRLFADTNGYTLLATSPPVTVN